MVRARSGRSMLGCLVTILVLVAVAYFGINLAEPHVRYYRFKDAMAQTASFGARLPDAEMIVRLRAKADSLGLPPGAHDLRVTRDGRSVTIAVDYEEVVELPGYTRRFQFHPRVAGRL